MVVCQTQALQIAVTSERQSERFESNKRTFAGLWAQLVELLDELCEEANEASIRDALIKPKVRGAPAPKRDRTPKAEPSTPANPVPPSKPKKEA